MNVPVLFGLLFLLPSTAPSLQPDPRPALLEIAEQAGTFSTLVAAVDAAGLTEALDADGPFTVFAPSDEAFAQLPPGTVEDLLRPERRDDLVAILTYHVVPGRVSALDALRVGEAATLQGEALGFRLEGGALRVNDVGVTANDIEARNGVIHVIDAVLLPPQPEPVNPALDLIMTAIDRGVPLFNEGQRAGCAAVYEVAARALVDLGCEAVPDATTEVLRQALGAAADQPSAADRAWTLRHALDEAARALVGFDGAPATTGADGSAGHEKLLFDFASGANPWPSVNDNVMGGISRGGARISDEGTGLFLGELSLDNNGGFATVRSPGRDLDLGGWSGLWMRVRGDGRTYTISALENDRRNELNYFQQSFETVAGEWTEVKIPFDQLKHRIMGWVRPGSRVDPADIRSLSVGISDKNTAPFALEIDWIKAYRDA